MSFDFHSHMIPGLREDYSHLYNDSNTSTPTAKLSSTVTKNQSRRASTGSIHSNSSHKGCDACLDTQNIKNYLNETYKFDYRSFEDREKLHEKELGWNKHHSNKINTNFNNTGKQFDLTNSSALSNRSSGSRVGCTVCEIRNEFSPWKNNNNFTSTTKRSQSNKSSRRSSLASTTSKRSSKSVGNSPRHVKWADQHHYVFAENPLWGSVV